MEEAKPHSHTSRSILAAALVLFITIAFAPTSVTVKADEGTEPKKATAAGANSAVASVRTAERNVQTPAGQFRVRLRQSPADPRAGEEAQFVVDLPEQPAKTNRYMS